MWLIEQLYIELGFAVVKVNLESIQDFNFRLGIHTNTMEAVITGQQKIDQNR